MADHPERAVSRAGELAGGLDDVAQHRFQGQVAGDGLDGMQQSAQPALGALDALCAVDELIDQLVELEFRDVRETAGTPAARPP